MTGPRMIVPTLTPSELAGAPGLAPAAHLTYHGGPVLTAVQVVTIFWGAAWTQAAQSALMPQINAFFDFILTSSVIDQLAEYSVPGQPIGRGSRIGTHTITASEPGGGSGTVSDAQIQQALQGWIANGTIEATNSNTLYFVYLPPGVVSTLNGAQSCQVFCGYHSHINGTIFYAVEPFINCVGCNFGQMIDSLTKVSSHELCEAITDPALNAWWDDSTGNENGDICNNTTTQIGGFTIQLEWSNQANACLLQPAIKWNLNDLTAAAGAPFAVGDPAGYTWDVDSTEHVVFRGSDSHIHELWFNGQWNHNDLTAAAAAPLAVGDPAGYTWDVDKTQHVVFRGHDSHIHELWFNGQWNHNDLTAAVGAPLAIGDPAGYTWSVDSTQHVVFQGSNCHVQELWFNGQWNLNDLTVAASAPDTEGAPTGYTWSVDSTEHVVFRGSDSHIYELWFHL